MPLTRARSSTVRKRPRLTRSSMIAAAREGPMPGSSCNCSAVAVLMSSVMPASSFGAAVSSGSAAAGPVSGCGSRDDGLGVGDASSGAPARGSTCWGTNTTGCGAGVGRVARLYPTPTRPTPETSNAATHRAPCGDGRDDGWPAFMPWSHPAHRRALIAARPPAQPMPAGALRSRRRDLARPWSWRYLGQSPSTLSVHMAWPPLLPSPG